MTYFDSDGREKTFRLWHPRQAVAKLRWEYDLLLKLEDEQAFEDAFAAFNAASTAWHLVEWTWHTLPNLKGPALVFPSQKDFRADCVGRFSGLHICGQIANGGKHFRLEKYDPDITTGHLVRLYLSPGSEPPPRRAPERRLMVSRSGKPIEFRSVISEAIQFWDRRLTDLGYRQLE